MLYEVITSQKGMKRELNQDRFIIEELKNGIVAALADGMGGEPGGEKASALAVSGINAVKQIPENREINFLVKIFHDRITSYNVCYTKLLRLPLERPIEIGDMSLVITSI